MKSSAAALVLPAFLLATIPGTARAQQSMITGQFGLGTGFEGGTPGTGTVAWHRARTRVVVGMDFGADELAYPAFDVRAFVELEHATSIGGAFHYKRWVTKSVGLFAGIDGVVAPKSLAGVDAGATFLFPLGSKTDFFLEPEISALPLGSDVPEDSVVIWALLSLGLRLDL